MLQDLDWKQLFTSIDGRINRQRWWAGMIVLFLIGTVAGVLFGDDGLIAFVISIALFLAGICLHIKRCHDRDKSGWWCLLLFVPVIGVLWALIELGMLEGTTGANRFGPDPISF